jgi:hypothetical protein
MIKNRDKIEELERQEEILSKLPQGTLLPDFIHIYKDRATVKWEVRTIQQIYDQLKGLGELLTVFVVKDGPVTIGPEADNRLYGLPGAKVLHTVPEGVMLTQEAGKGFSSVTVKAWPACLGGKISLKFEVVNFPWEKRTFLRTSYNKSGDCVQAELVKKPLTGVTVQYATGARDHLHYVQVFSGLEEFLERCL